MDQDDYLRKYLSFLLWDAAKPSLQKLDDFVKDEDILTHPQFSDKRYSLEDIQRAVNIDAGQRFMLIAINRELENSKPVECCIKKELEQKDQSFDITLGFYLRHVDLEQMTDDGFIEVENLFRLAYFFERKITLKALHRVVNGDEMRRFKLVKCGNGKFKIKVFYGHTIKRLIDWCFQNWEENTKIKEICFKCEYSAWQVIKLNGFRKEHTFEAFYFLRDPRHPHQKDNDEKKDVIIWIDAVRARKDGAKFFKVAEKKMIATQGIGEGIAVKYFQRVIDIHTGEKLAF